MQVSWEEPLTNGAAVHSYSLQLAAEGESFHGVEYEGAQPKYVALGVETGVSYRLRVQALNSEGASPFSAVHLVSTLPGKPDPPTNLALVELHL